MRHEYRTHGTCSSMITFNLDGDRVSGITFTGGCNGNLKAISKILEGQSVDFIEKTLSGNTCGLKQTSCADQLAKAVRSAYDEENSD